MKLLLRILGILSISVAVFLTSIYTSTIVTTYLVAKYEPPVNNVVCEVEKKPSYDYLKSITVYLEGKGEGEKTGIKYMLTGETDKEVQMWSGTGVIVKIDKVYTYILTNAHVAGGDFKKAEVFVKEGKDVVSQVEIIEYSKDYDMALLRIAKKFEGKVAVVGFNSVKPQDRVYMVGHYLGIPYIYSQGWMAGYEEDSKDGILMQLPGAFGNSGSGVVNENGELVALVYAVHGVGLFAVDTSKVMAVDSSNIMAFLYKHKVLGGK